MEWTGPMMQPPGGTWRHAPSAGGMPYGYTAGWGAPGPGHAAGWGAPGPGYAAGWGVPGPGYAAGWGAPGPGYAAGWGAPGPGYAAGWGAPGPGYAAGWGAPGAMPPVAPLPSLAESLPGILAICLMSGLTLSDGPELALLVPETEDSGWPTVGTEWEAPADEGDTHAVMALPGLPLGPTAGDADGMLLWPEGQMVVMPDEPVEESE